MRTRSSSNLHVESPPNPSTSNLKHRNYKRSKQPFILEESPVDAMADQRTMAELLRAPTEGYAEAIVVPQFLLSNSSSSTAWDRYKYLIRACPYHGFTELHQLDTFYNALNLANQDSLNSAAGGNLLESRTQDVLMIIKNKSKVCNSRNKSVVSQVKSSDANFNSFSKIAKLTHAFNQQTSAVTTAMIAILKQFQATPPPASVKAVEEICVTCGGAHPYYQCLAAGGNTFPELRDNIQGYVAAAAINYNQGNFGYRPLEQSYQAPTQQIPLSELEKIKRVNEANMKAMQTQINNVKNKLRNEMKNSIQASMSNQTNELKNMMTSFSQMNTASTSGSGSLLSNTISNSKGRLKAITTQNGIVLDGPSVTIPPPFINQEEDERLHINITLVDALILIPKYQKMLKALLYNKEKILELENTPLNKNCSAVILKKLHEKLGDPKKFLILCGFSELKCKALADLGASINLMPLSVWKKLCLPEFISTQMTLELANRAICTSAGIERDVFIPYGKFTFLANFVIVDYESDPRVPLIMGRPFLRIAHALIDVYGEEMILCDGDERLTLNMRHDTSSYSNQPKKESIILINVFNDSSEDFLENLFSTNLPSGNPTFSPHPKLPSPEVKDDVFDPEGGKEFADKQALITFPPEFDNDLTFDIEFDLKVINYLLHHDPIKDMDSSLKDPIDQSDLTDLNDNLVDTIPEMFTDEHALDSSSPPIYDEYDDDLFKVESDTIYVYDDPFDSKGEKIKEYVGPFKVLERIGDVAYKLDLPEELNRVHNTLQVSNLKKCHADKPLAVSLDGLHFDDKLHFVEEPVEILNREELTDELALITFPPKYDDDLQFDVESDLKEIEFLLHREINSSLKDSINQSNLANPVDNFVDFMPEMFTDEHALDYSSPPIYDEYDDDLFKVESDTIYVYDDPFDSKGEKIKESKLLIDELDLPSELCPSSKYDSFLSEDFSKVDALPSNNNEDKVFNPGILIQENLFKIITRVAPDKNAKKLAISHASLILKDFDPPLYELPFFKEVPRYKILLSFSSENEEKVFKPGILTSKEVYSSLIPELSHRGYKVFKINQILKSPMKIFLFSCREDIHILDVPCLYFTPLTSSSMGELGQAKRPYTSASWEAPHAYLSFSNL
uniref:Reverse transcriptase domain-containing protein n=1 Tax=Tanacetum cinerariifolium TaxID=118510 RepID=A0A6L2MIV7_TANCI|nr:reverse transcriptase domain-containing protein [Tanacetum cinerariifolium]